MSIYVGDQTEHGSYLSHRLGTIFFKCMWCILLQPKFLLRQVNSFPNELWKVFKLENKYEK